MQLLRHSVMHVLYLLSACCYGNLLADELPALIQPGDSGYVFADMIFPSEQAPTRQCHASTIVARDGQLAAAWFGGTKEGHDDVGIWFSVKSEATWSTPVELADGSQGEENDYPCWNPVLFSPAAGSLVLYYKVGPHPRLWWGMVMTSSDWGKSWSSPHKIGKTDAWDAEHFWLLGPVKNKPVIIDGAWLFPSSTEHDGWKTHLEITRDRGQTWQVIGPVPGYETFQAIQPSLLRYLDGRLQLLCRTREGVIAESWSEDGGVNWSELAASPLPNPNSGTDAVTLKDGRQLLVYNHTSQGRSPLNVAFTNDGLHWITSVTLENSPGEYSYPAVIEDEQRLVHITYTWQRKTIKHVILDPRQIITQ